MAWTVVINPSIIPNLSLMTLAKGAKQFVVQLAFDTTFKSDVYFFSLTPQTNIGTLSFGGAEMMTFLQPPLMWSSALSYDVKTPVDSQTYSAPDSPHLIAAGSFSAKTWIF